MSPETKSSPVMVSPALASFASVWAFNVVVSAPTVFNLPSSSVSPAAREAASAARFPAIVVVSVLTSAYAAFAARSGTRLLILDWLMAAEVVGHGQ